LKRFAQNLLLAVLATLICVVLFEITLTLLVNKNTLGGQGKYFLRTGGKLYSSNVEPYHIALKPSTIATLESAEYRVQYFINSLGFRDYEFTKEKNSDVLRIAVVGDSITFGTGVELEQTFSKVLERRLNLRPELSDWKIEVLNLGVGAASAGQNFLRIKYDALTFEPDLILYAYYANDAMEWPYYPDGSGILPKSYRVSGEHWDKIKKTSTKNYRVLKPIAPPQFLSVGAQNFQTLKLILKAWHKWLNPPYLSPGSSYVVGDPWNDPFWPLRPNVRRDQTLEWKNHLQIVQASVKIVLRTKTKFLGIVIPPGIVVNDYEWGVGRELHFFDRNQTHSDNALVEVVEAIQDAGGAAIYLKPPLAEFSQPSKRMFFPYDGHLTAYGHQIVAKSLEGVIVDKLRK
jgi:lysophospholipase L1-like esterase